MSQRLPIPGQDDGTWGDILNGFLEVSHNQDGTLISSAVSSAGAELTVNKNQPSGYAGLNSSGFVPVALLPANIPISDLATTGTASSSTYLRGDGIWATPAAGVTLDSTNTDIQPLGAQAAGTNGQAARADHVHPTTGLITTTTSAGGDLAGTYPNPTLTSTSNVQTVVNNIISSNTTVTSKAPLASPALTGTPTAPTAAANTNTTQIATTAFVETAIPTSLPPSGTAGGDLTGTFPNPTLTGSTNVENIITANTTVAGALQKTGGTMSGVIAMGSNKITGLTNGSAGSDAAAFGQIPTAGTGSTNYAVGNDSRITGALQTTGGIMTGPIGLIQQADPANPVSGVGDIYAKLQANRERLHQISSTGAAVPVATEQWSKTWVLLTPLSGSIRTAGWGASVTISTGTLTTPGLTANGYLANMQTAATAGVTTYFNTGTIFRRGTTGDLTGGFFFHSRVYFPDASYNNTGASTGSRIFAGLANVAPSTVLAADNGGNAHLAGFRRCNVNGGATDTDWQFITNSGTATNANIIDTGIPFTATHVYALTMWCPLGSANIYWQVEDKTSATTASGNSASSTFIPGATQALLAFYGLETIDATARNIQFRDFYAESDQG
jgi:hypothetical protein